MDEATQRDELLRENCCIGNIDNIKNILIAGANINSHNSVNGMTALHWACQRNLKPVVQFLLKAGADPTQVRHDGSLPVDLATSPEVRSLIDPKATPPPPPVASVENNSSKESVTFVPNYLKHPEFPYNSESLIGTGLVNQPSDSVRVELQEKADTSIIIKVRQMGCNDGDFYEMPCQRNSLSYEQFVGEVCKELNVKPEDVIKLRKLPSTIIRKIEDIQRLEPYQEIEIVTK